MLIIIAWKNIWRNKLRSIIVVVAVSIGLFAGVFASAFMRGLGIQRINSAIENETSSIQIHTPDYILNREINDTIKNLFSLTPLLDTIPEIAAYSKRIKINAMALTATTGTAIMLYGIEPEKEKKVTGIYKFIIDSLGTYFEEKKNNSIIIGKKLAEKLNVRLKSKIVLNMQSCDGTIISTAFRVSGIYKSSNANLDEVNVFVAYHNLAPLIGFTGSQAHEIAILSKNNNMVGSLKDKLIARMPGQSVMTWKEISPDLGMIDDMQKKMIYVILLIILLALCFGIINTMLMAILERTREIGMLMAVGMIKIKVFFMIMAESILLTFTGAAIGIGIAAAAIYYFNTHGINLANLSEGLEAAGISTTVYPIFIPGYFINTSLLVLLTGILSSVIPAKRALKLNPAEAIRE